MRGFLVYGIETNPMDTLYYSVELSAAIAVGYKRCQSIKPIKL